MKLDSVAASSIQSQLNNLSATNTQLEDSPAQRFTDDVLNLSSSHNNYGNESSQATYQIELNGNGKKPPE